MRHLREVPDQINGGRGATWEDARRKLRARFPFGKWDIAGGNLTDSLLAEGDDFFSVSAADIKSATTRRHAKPDDCDSA